MSKSAQQNPTERLINMKRRLYSRYSRQRHQKGEEAHQKGGQATARHINKGGRHSVAQVHNANEALALAKRRRVSTYGLCSALNWNMFNMFTCPCVIHNVTCRFSLTLDTLESLGRCGIFADGKETRICRFRFFLSA